MTSPTTRNTFRFRIYPTPEQVETLNRWEDALRFLWNVALEQRLAGLKKRRGK